MGLKEIRKNKEEKLKRIKKAGINPYPSKTNQTHAIKGALDNFDLLEKSKENVILVGRIMTKREHGGSIFLDLNDGTDKIQIYFKKDVLGENEFEFFQENIDTGDFIEAAGSLFVTRKNEKTLEVRNYKLLAKALLPLPEKWHGLQDVEERYRKRYLDLIFNSEVREKFKLRTKIVQETRNYFIKNNFMEVDTPVLQSLAGGANARPFKTHMNDLDINLYLRIAPELYLKRLMVAGFEKVFEIGKSFRNEGTDREHNPEFMMLEAYAAYRDYEWMMVFIENFFRDISKEIFGTAVIQTEKDTIDFSNTFERIEFNQILEKYANLNYDNASENDLKEKAEELKIKIEKNVTKGVIADEIYKKLVRPKIIQPTFVINHPLDISPLSKKIENNPSHVERFQLLVGGMEVVNGFSELNDPIDQKERFKEQEKMYKKGDEEAQRMDKDYIQAMEYGMPPAAGVGIGIDRMVVLFTGSHSLREVILFPIMRPDND